LSTAACDISARPVEETASVSTAGSEASARNVEGRVFVSADGFAPDARSAEGGVSVSVYGRIRSQCRSAGVRAYVSTVAFAVSARNAEGRPSASTADNAPIARNVEERASVFTKRIADSVRSASCFPLCLLNLLLPLFPSPVSVFVCFEKTDLLVCMTGWEGGWLGVLLISKSCSISPGEEANCTDHTKQAKEPFYFHKEKTFFSN